jgi:hypothetical protein
LREENPKTHHEQQHLTQIRQTQQPQDDQGYDRQTGPGAEKALGQQASIALSIIEFGHDCLFGLDDLEGTHVFDQGE